jgi:phosphomevalonate kinase
MTINENSTILAVTHCGVTASFETSETDIDTMFVLFKAALIAMTYQQDTIDDAFLRMAEEINDNQ